MGGALLLCAAGGAGAGCVYDPQVRGGREGSLSGDGGGAGLPEQPFAPVSMRVHPLTHVDAAGGAGSGAELGDGMCLLVLHLEMKDAYADTVKGVGSLRVELARGEGESVAWDVSEMLDPKANSARFDAATRTYRLPLKAPAWTAAWARGEGSAKVTLRAMFTMLAGDGRRSVLRDEFVLAR